MEDLVDPPWYDPVAAAALTGRDWDYATSMGRSAGALSTMAWTQLEPILQSLWYDMTGYPPWEEARQAVYRAWRKERSKHDGTSRDQRIT
jgi:hypothetical protein